MNPMIFIYFPGSGNGLKERRNDGNGLGRKYSLLGHVFEHCGFKPTQGRPGVASSTQQSFSSTRLHVHNLLWLRSIWPLITENYMIEIANMRKPFSYFTPHWYRLAWLTYIEIIAAMMKMRQTFLLNSRDERRAFKFVYFSWLILCWIFVVVIFQRLNKWALVIIYSKTIKFRVMFNSSELPYPICLNIS